MNERDLTRDLEAWLADPTPPLDEHTLHQTIDRLPYVPQRRRWWPLRWFPRGLGATRSAKPDGPHRKRRSTTMFSATRVVAAVAILALSGSLALLAGPISGPSESVAPGAVSPSPSATPLPDGSHVQGRIDFRITTDPPPNFGETTADDTDGTSLYRGARFETSWLSNDTRLSGTGEYTANSNTYPAGLNPAITVGWGTQSLATDEGTWTSRDETFGIIGDDESVIPVWFEGGGAYDGMSLFLLQEVHPIEGRGSYFTFEGWIVPSDRHFDDASR